MLIEPKRTSLNELDVQSEVRLANRLCKNDDYSLESNRHTVCMMVKYSLIEVRLLPN